MQHFMILEGRLLFIFRRYESILDDVMEIKLYEDTCRKNLIDYQTNNLVKQLHSICDNLKNSPTITVEQNDKKFKSTLFSVIFREGEGTFTVSLYFTQNQFLFSERRNIPGLTD